MKLVSDKAKFNIYFWLVTIPFFPFFLVVILGILPIGLFSKKYSNRLFDRLDIYIHKFIRWRHNIPFVKKAYDKAHLFDYLTK